MNYQELQAILARQPLRIKYRTVRILPSYLANEKWFHGIIPIDFKLEINNRKDIYEIDSLENDDYVTKLRFVDYNDCLTRTDDDSILVYHGDPYVIIEPKYSQLPSKELPISSIKHNFSDTVVENFCRDTVDYKGNLPSTYLDIEKQIERLSEIDKKKEILTIYKPNFIFDYDDLGMYTQFIEIRVSEKPLCLAMYQDGSPSMYGKECEPDEIFTEIYPSGTPYISFHNIQPLY